MTFFGRFSVARPETDVIMNGGLVQVHKLYIIFHIRRLVCCIRLSSKEAHESCHATSRVLTHGHVTWLGRQCIVQVLQAGRAPRVPRRFHRHHRHEPSRLLSSWAGLAYPVGLRVGPARAYGVACTGSSRSRSGSVPPACRAGRVDGSLHAARSIRAACRTAGCSLRSSGCTWPGKARFPGFT